MSQIASICYSTSQSFVPFDSALESRPLKDLTNVQRSPRKGYWQKKMNWLQSQVHSPLQNPSLFLCSYFKLSHGSIFILETLSPREYCFSVNSSHPKQLVVYSLQEIVLYLTCEIIITCHFLSGCYPYLQITVLLLFSAIWLLYGIQ